MSLSPTATETLFADRRRRPGRRRRRPLELSRRAPTTDLSGYKPNVEAIAGYEPDLVVMSDDIDGVEAQLEALGIEMLVLPAAADARRRLRADRAARAATGHVDEAAEVVRDDEDQHRGVPAEVPDAAPLTYYHELDNTLFSVTSKTFIGEVYAPRRPREHRRPADAARQSGYPQLSAEFLVDADPDLVFLADTKCCNESSATFGARPGFDALDAVGRPRGRARRRHRFALGTADRRPLAPDHRGAWKRSPRVTDRGRRRDRDRVPDAHRPAWLVGLIGVVVVAVVLGVTVGPWRSRRSAGARAPRPLPGPRRRLRPVARGTRRSCGTSASRGSCSACWSAAMLSIAGGAYQGAFRNPLADP